MNVTIRSIKLHFGLKDYYCPRKMYKGKKICKTQTLTASIQPNNKDILQILLAIIIIANRIYFTSCNKKSKIKDKKHKHKIDFPSLVSLVSPRFHIEFYRSPK